MVSYAIRNSNKREYRNRSTFVKVERSFAVATSTRVLSWSSVAVAKPCEAITTDTKLETCRKEHASEC